MARPLLPKNQPRTLLGLPHPVLMLPAPHHRWLAVGCVAAIASAVVLWFAMSPARTLHTTLTDIVVQFIIAVVIVDLVALVIMLGKLFRDLGRREFATAERDRKIVTMLLFGLLAIMFFTSVVEIALLT